MSDSYQAIYDAIRSQLRNCDVGAAVNEAVSLQIQGASWAIEAIKSEHLQNAHEHRRPAVLFRPALFQDGNQWCALYGENIQSGIAGFGDTPEKAMLNFDIQWLNAKS